MDDTTAKRIIDNVMRKHKKFQVRSIRAHDSGAYVTFDPIDTDPRTICKWIEAEGVYVPIIGTLGTGDRAVMHAEMKLS